MKRLVITESEKQRILGMHSNPSLKGKLFEQSNYQAFATIKGKAVPVNPSFLEFGKGSVYVMRDAMKGLTDEGKLKETVGKINSQDAYNAVLWAVQNAMGGGEKYPTVIEYIQSDYGKPDDYYRDGGIPSWENVTGDVDDLKYFSSVLTKFNSDEQFKTNIQYDSM